MKVVALNCSPRPNGNTHDSLQTVLTALAKEGIETELLQVEGKTLSGCRACGACAKLQNRRCVIEDGMNEFLEKMYAADGILIGSPVYYGNITTECKALIDRAGMVAGTNGHLLKHKAGAAVVGARRAGSTFAYAAINYLFGISEMIIPCASYWNLFLAREEGEMLQDGEAVATFQNLGENMAWLLKRIAD